jgi:toxin-antitoxin system PIN domain toxin
MTSSIFPDVNVWLALSYPGHVHQAAASMWFASMDESTSFVFCRQTQLAFFRLMTTEAVLGPDVISQTDCWAIYDRWINAGKAVLAREPAGIEAALRKRTSLNSPSPKVWADAYLAAFAETAGLTLATFDRTLAGQVKGTILLS